MRAVRRAIAGAVVAAAVFAAPASAAVPATLSGEIFSNNPGEGSSSITSASCDPSGTSTFSFEASGPAVGPYPGTFTETGTVTLGPQTPGLGTAIQTLTASYTITSAAGDVTGTKSFTGPSDPIASQAGSCLDADATLGTIRSANLDSAGVTYDARIETADGTFFDRGRADVNVLEQDVGSVHSSDFREAFFSDLVAVVGSKPGLGCGDANHVHEREDQCRKPAR
jgi:hypothetical protein